MDRISTTTVAGPTTSSAVQLRRLCRQILGPTVHDEILSTNFRTALQLLSSSASGQLDTNIDEFVITEKIKKYLVRDGRENEIPIFNELLQRLQRSPIIKNRLSILCLLFNLSERTNQGNPKRPLLFIPGGVENQHPEKVDALGGAQGLPPKTTSKARPTSLVNGFTKSSTNADGQAKSPSSGYHPPLPPKPRQLLKSRENSSAQTPAAAAEISADEADLIRELLYVFQGIEGVIFRRSHQGGDDIVGFSITQSFRDKFPAPVVHLSLRLAELGWLFNVVHQFCEKKSTEKEIGLISQSFVTALKDEMSEYYQLLANLESEFLRKDKAQTLTLHQLSVFTLEPLMRLKLLCNIVNTCGKLRGGALISGLHGFLHHGNTLMAKTVERLMTTVCKPLYLMILKWMLDGILEDSYAEFFIASDCKIQDESRLWHDKYSIRRMMIPKFLGLSWVKKILATGKSINFLHSVCHNNVPIPGKEAMKKTLQEKTSPANLFIDPTDNKFHEVLDRCYRETSSLVLSILLKKYKFIEHVGAMRKYLLLGQGDLIRYLLELLDEELCKPATHLYPHNLAGILETAIRATNTQYEDPDILDRLDVRLLDIQPGDTGWDVFSLDYKVQGPLGTVIGQRSMTFYLMLFNSLWRAKRMEWILSCVWTRQTGMHKMVMKTLPELKPVLHMANLLSSEMVHFVHQLSYYTAFEVMECSWDQLIKQLKEAENLDEVIEAHTEFLETIVRRGLLDERSRDVLTQLRAIYDRIVEFSNVQNNLYVMSAAESEARLSYELEIRARERRKEYGVTQDEEDAEMARRNEFSSVTLQDIKTQLKIICQSYQDMVKTFLLQLTCSQDQSLQCLSFRLDFNEHYKKKDKRLGTSLTFHNRRLSLLDYDD